MTNKISFYACMLFGYAGLVLSGLLIANFWSEQRMLMNMLLLVSGLLFGGVLFYWAQVHLRVMNNLLKSIEEVNPSLVKYGRSRFSKLFQVSRSVQQLLISFHHNRMAIQDILDGNFSTKATAHEKIDDFVLANEAKALLDRLANSIDRQMDSSHQSSQSETGIALNGAKGTWSAMITSIDHLRNQLSGPLDSLSSIINAMAEGDLTRRGNTVQSGEFQEMFQHLNDALDNLDGLLYQVNTAAVNIAAYAAEMAQTSQEISQSTSESAVAIDQISQGSSEQHARVNDCQLLVGQVVDASQQMKVHTQDILQASEAGMEKSKAGLGAIEQMVVAMDEIHDSSEKSDQAMARLLTSAQKVSAVIRVMEEIAAQTNLLSVNAAIEAANAGEHGRSFGVVADEIRKLSSQAKSSTSDISTLLGEMYHDMKATSQSLERMGDKVSKGKTITSRANEAFEEIIANSEKATELVHDIFKSTDLQIEAISTMNGSLENIVVVAEQNASGTNELAASMNELSSSMVGFNQRIRDLSAIASELKEGLSMVRLTGKAQENTLIFKMKAAYEHEKYLLDALLNHMPDAIYFKDRESKFIRNSLSHARLFGLESPEQLLGKSDRDFFGEHAETTHAEEQRIMETSEPLLNAVEKEDLSNGAVRYVSTTKMPLYDTEANIVGTFGISRDITELKEKEQNMDQLIVAQQQQAREIDHLRRENEDLKRLMRHETEKINFKDAS